MGNVVELPWVDIDGCQYVIGSTQRYNRQTKKWDTIHRYCHKVRSGPESAMCPHHELVMAAHEAGAHSLKSGAHRKKIARERAALNQAALEQSPLRVIPEETEEQKPTGYEK